MEDNKIQDALAQRTDEIQDIIDKMPTRFGLYITYLVISIVVLLVFFGSLIRYPDTATGRLTVNTQKAPIKLICAASGKLHLIDIKSHDIVKEKQVLGWIENATTPADIKWLNNFVENLDIEKSNASNIYKSLPTNKSLGELTTSYVELLQAIKNVGEYQSSRLIEKQIIAEKDLYMQQKVSLKIIAQQKENTLKSVSLGDKFYSRDSILFANKVISAAEFDRSKLTKIASYNQYQEILKEISSTHEKLNATVESIKELEIKKNETFKDLTLRVASVKNTIIAQINEWENRYLIKSPFEGKIQFLGFWHDNEFIQSGQPLFTVVPNNSQIIGQVILPSIGAGKVKVGQKVIVKLDDYPYLEYGSINGYVSQISLATNTVSTSAGNIETYLVNVNLPHMLKTNYGSTLVYKNEIKGSAEIITRDRTFIERFFENLKYGTNNN